MDILCVGMNPGEILLRKRREILRGEIEEAIEKNDRFLLVMACCFQQLSAEELLLLFSGFFLWSSFLNCFFLCSCLFLWGGFLFSSSFFLWSSFLLRSSFLHCFLFRGCFFLWCSFLYCFFRCCFLCLFLCHRKSSFES